MARLLSQNTFYRPAVSQAAGNGAFWPTKALRPLGDVERYAVVGQESIAAPVVGLLFAAGPFAVIRRVVFGVVNVLTH